MKFLYSIVGLLVGPMFIIVTNPFLNWTATGGLITLALLSGTSVYYIWRKPKEGENLDRVWAFVRRCWNGDLELWKMWCVSVSITVVIKFISYLGTQYSAPIIWWASMLVLLTPVEVWWIVSLWRCAKNAKKKLWTISTRFCVVICGGYYAYRLFWVVAYPFGI